MQKKDLEINKQYWNSIVDSHYSSDFYNVKKFLENRNSLNEIELSFLGKVNDKQILHLMCHFGMDYLSMANMGANITGLDFSEVAIKKARKLNEMLSFNATFICANILDAQKVIQQKFDIIYMSYGTIGWLPDMNKWAEIVNSLLKPFGQLILVEFHPFVWMFNDNFDEIIYSYFNKEAIYETTDGSYADPGSGVKKTNVGWNHPMEEVLSALLENGFVLDKFKEFDYSPYNCFSNMVKLKDNQYQIKGFEGKLPIVYALEASKKS